MKLKVIALAAAASAALILTACSTTTNSGGDAPLGGDIVAPVTMGVNQLQGAEVELVVGQALNVDTESLAVDSYTAEISDAKVLEFTQGGTSGGAEFTPGCSRSPRAAPR